jgi:hypothetical protein
MAQSVLRDPERVTVLATKFFNLSNNPLELVPDLGGLDISWQRCMQRELYAAACALAAVSRLLKEAEEDVEDRRLFSALTEKE